MKNGLVAEYKIKKPVIRQRLKEFEAVWKQSDRKIFSELCFCICTPQSKAVYCDKAVSVLVKNNALYNGDVRQIRAGLRAVRFPNNKARFIYEARKLFMSNGSLNVKNKLDTKDIIKSRRWLVKNVKGLGFKEASHFLRNVGFGKHLAILDVHILKNMEKYKVISVRPKNMNEAWYLLLEDKLKDFSKKIKIPMDELDLLFWSHETGEVFK